jgi:NAD(P)H dehydrogenase (quinone)
VIIVTGATGQLGHAVVERLVKRIGADQVGVSVRDSSKATELQSLGVRVRQGTFDDPETLRHTFEGATQLLIVSSNAGAHGGDPRAQHRSAIDAARSVGAKRIVYTSHMAASQTSAFPPMLDHFATEQMLQASGIAWTALRNGFYAASGISMMGDAIETGLLESPADGLVSWTAHADLAEAAAVILTDDRKYVGPTPPLTGSQSLDFAGIATLVNELRKDAMRRVTIADDELRAKFTARGAPERALNTVLGFFIASRNGEFATVDPTLERLIGRRPIKMQEFVAEALSKHENTRA